MRTKNAARNAERMQRKCSSFIGTAVGTTYRLILLLLAYKELTGTLQIAGHPPGLRGGRQHWRIELGMASAFTFRLDPRRSSRPPRLGCRYSRQLKYYVQLPKSQTQSLRRRLAMGEQSQEPGGRDGRAWSGRARKRRHLSFLAQEVNYAVIEICVESRGRPLAMAITDFVERTIEVIACGYSVDALYLELRLLDGVVPVPGETLTGVQKQYRTQWISALHAVMQHLNLAEQRAPVSAEEFNLKSQVGIVLRGRRTHDEQTFVKLDEALATGGVAGGVATEPIVIAPQMLPISQLVLLAIRALQKLEDAAQH